MCETVIFKVCKKTTIWQSELIRIILCWYLRSSAVLFSPYKQKIAIMSCVWKGVTLPLVNNNEKTKIVGLRHHPTSKQHRPTAEQQQTNLLKFYLKNEGENIDDPMIQYNFVSRSNVLEVTYKTAKSRTVDIENNGKRHQRLAEVRWPNLMSLVDMSKWRF